MSTKHAVEHALARLANTARTLEEPQGRIARRNARRRVFAALRAVRLTVDRAYPAVAIERPREHRLDAAAKRMGWRRFEYTVVKNVRREWDGDEAQRFIDLVCATKKVTRRELAVEALRGNLHGQCGSEVIVLHEDLPASEKWRTLIHELAHAIEGTMPGGAGGGTHRRRFVRAMAEVYILWVAFVRPKLAATPAP
jgi:hypothetical protein